MSFFKKIAGGATNVFKKATGGIDTALRKTINTAGTIGKYVDQATPMLSAINPELGSSVGSFSSGLQQGSGALKQIRGVNQAVRSGDISGAIQKAKAVSAQQPTSFY